MPPPGAAPGAAAAPPSSFVDRYDITIGASRGSNLEVLAARATDTTELVDHLPVLVAEHVLDDLLTLAGVHLVEVHPALD
jgi:hypothetical protein